MKHLILYENYLMQNSRIPLLDVLKNRNLINFSVLPDQNTVVVSQSDGKGGVIPGSSYKYKTQGTTFFGDTDIIIKSITTEKDGGVTVKALPISPTLKNTFKSQIGPDGWFNSKVRPEKVDDLIGELIKSGGKKGTLKTKTIDVKFNLIF